MKKLPLHVFCIGFVIATLPCQGECGRATQKVQADAQKMEMQKQKSRGRNYSRNELNLLMEVTLENCQFPVYRADTVKAAENGAFFLFDNYNSMISKFTIDFEKKFVKQLVFGKGKGQGPGELSNMIDFKIYRDRLYLVDAVTNSIEVYTTDGKYDQRMRALTGVQIYKISFLDGRLVIGQATSNPSGYLLLKDNEKWFSFGDRIIHRSIENPVYHDYFLSDSFDRDRFYYFSLYCGFAAQYKNSDLVFVRETIDGLKEPENVRIKMDDNTEIQKISARFTTAICAARFGEYLLLKSADKEAKQSNWDVYRLTDFEYITSIRNPPKKVYPFDISGDLLVCLDEEKLKVYDLKNVRAEIEGRSKI